MDLSRAFSEVAGQTQAIRERRSTQQALCPLYTWTDARVLAWLTEIDVPASVRSAFEEQGMDGVALCKLSRMDDAVQDKLLTTDLGMTRLGDRLRFSSALEGLLRAGDVNDLAPVPDVPVLPLDDAS
mmetsp:Transcript_5450/g.15949  ORF Transcript_5450/g.15949 Transcript_5450/m.15949 type:complete len:127 (-) Transcript_5450:129-509(-)